MATIVLPKELRLTPAGDRRRCSSRKSEACQDYQGVMHAADLQSGGICCFCLEALGYRSVCDRPTADENAPGYTDAVCANCGRLDCSPTKMAR